MQTHKNFADLSETVSEELQLHIPVCLRLLFARLRPGVRDTGRAGFYLVVGFAVTTAMLAVAMQLPHLPYNLKELFGDKTLWLSLPALSAFFLWSTGTPNLAARLTIICPGLHVLQPLLLLLLVTPAWLLLRFAISTESMIDVLGEPVLGWPDDWELYVRFLALSVPLFLPLYYWNLLFEGSAWISRWFGLGQMLTAFLIGLPLLWLSKYIVVDHAATDRVITLSAQGPSWMVGGALMATMAIVAANGVIIGWMAVWPAKRALTIALMTPFLFLASWWFLSYGLSPDGILLLLGVHYGDQSETLGLLLRWLLIYTGAIVVVACAHLIPFRLRGSPMSQRQAYTHSGLHAAVKVGSGSGR